jgi:hypothetical protein
VFTGIKMTVAAAFIASAASAVLANNIDTTSNETQRTSNCPALEGYPDCHSYDRASSSAHSTDQRRPVPDRSRR